MNEQKKENVVICFFGISIFLSIVICVFIARHQTAIKKLMIEDVNEISGQVSFCIDRVEVDTMQYSGRGTAQTGAGYKYYVIEGWAGYGDKDIETFNTKVLLKPEGSDNLFLSLHTEMVLRSDLETIGPGGVSYERGGFVSRVKKLDLKKGKYSIYLLYCNDQNRILVNTERILEVTNK